MEFFAVNGQRPTRLSEATRLFAYESMNHKYGKETWENYAVSMDDYPDFDKLPPMDKYDVTDTSGYVPFESFERILPYTDLFLYDIKCLNAEKHKELVGVGNGLIIDNLKKLLALDARVIVRIPVIADVNDGIDEMQSIKKLLDSFGKKVKVELLPYHAMGESKYTAIDQNMRRFQPPTPEKMQALKAIFE